jgi:hypothetical protein
MISFWISVVPPKIAMTGLGSVDSRVGREFLPFTKKIWPVTRALPRATLARSLAGKRVFVVGTPVSHSGTRAVITPR